MTPQHGMTGNETEWRGFAAIEIRSGQMLVVDAYFAPSIEDGVPVELPEGRYQVSVRVMEYGTDHRVSRLRAQLEGSSATLGGVIGETWTDVARTGICDPALLSAAWGEDEAGRDEILERELADADLCHLLVVDETTAAVMPSVMSGFGDGSFPVYELTENGRRVGAEVEFIQPDEPYPF